MFAKLQVWMWAAGAAVLTVLGFLLRLKLVTQQRDKFREEKNAAEAKVRQDAYIRERDAEIDREYSDLRREADRDKKDGRIPKHLSDPNTWD